MRVHLFAIGLILCICGFSSAQAAGGQKMTDQRHSQAARSSLPKHSPAELRRCGLSHKISPIQVRSATLQHRRHGGVNGRGKGRGQGL
jgi:hypothetical protein